MAVHETGQPAPDITDIMPGAFLTDGRRLFEVLAINGDRVTLENSSTQHAEETDLLDVLEEPWRLVWSAYARAVNAELT